jgi:nucleotide-binding universal stress UspA family protein
MYQFDKILIALDHSDLDQELIIATSIIAKLAGTKSVVFMNTIRNMNIPSSIKKEFPNIVNDALKERKGELEREIDRLFTYDKDKVSVEIKVGAPTKIISKYSAKNDIDLIIVGRKNEKPSGGTVIQRLARRAPCSLLIIPKGFKKTISKILVPIDFSDHSLDAINQTIDLLKINHFPKPKFYTQHVYQVPSGYHYTGKSFDEFGTVMAEHAHKDYTAFMRKAEKSDLEIESIYTLDRQEDTISAIYRTAKEINAGTIIIGAKGITAAAALFIGSSAEKLVQMAKDIPLLVVRPKGKHKGLIDYLKEI